MTTWIPEDPRSRTTRFGGYQPPSFGSKRPASIESGLPLTFMGQVLLPNGKLLFFYTDPDAVHNGDWGNYFESYEHEYDENLSFQKDPPESADHLDHAIVEGGPMPEGVEFSDEEPDWEYIFEEAYRPAELASEPRWVTVDDTPNDVPYFLFQFPIEQNEDGSWKDDDAQGYVFWDGESKARVIWQFSWFMEEGMDDDDEGDDEMPSEQSSPKGISFLKSLLRGNSRT